MAESAIPARSIFPSGGPVAIPVAEYVRMSTENQQYSIENQMATNRVYAGLKGFEIHKTYSDAGKSGLSLRDRPGLAMLLQDVIGRKGEFKAILVYDVSRWGRFQDSDESAHYEFLCKSAGVAVHYCAEQFPNDSSMANTIMKAVKRAMAAEFSRDLSDKVFAGEKHIAELGFKQGGSAGYGLRRLMVSSNGTNKRILERGEVKSLQSDRVLLTPGDPIEVALVREIFRLVIEEEKSPVEIARELNASGQTKRGKSWVRQDIYRILTNPKYAGCCVWNRCSRRIGSRRKSLPTSEWVLKAGAFESIVDLRIFQQAQYVLGQRTLSLSNEELLERLRKLLAVNGKLTIQALKKSANVPSQSVYKSRFGSVKHAFELAGYIKNRKP